MQQKHQSDLTLRHQLSYGLRAVKKSGDDLTGELSANLHIAVEDQIVQKVMSKLRGIETRGKSYQKAT